MGHSADAWEVVSDYGTVLAIRSRLALPDVTEQQFMRSLSGAQIPSGQSRVAGRARDSGHGYGGEAVTVEVPGR